MRPRPAEFVLLGDVDGMRPINAAIESPTTGQADDGIEAEADAGKFKFRVEQFGRALDIFQIALGVGLARLFHVFWLRRGWFRS